MSYEVQRGDTIAKVTSLMKMSWKTLRRLNPDSVGQSNRTGHWFLKEGAVIKSEADFGTILKQKQEKEELPQPLNSTSDSDQWKEYTIKPGDTLWSLAVKKYHVHVEDLIKDNHIQDPRRIRPGKKIRIRLPSYPEKQEVTASWYGKSHHGRAMANGEIYNMYADTIAHKNLPFGTRVELENPITGEAVKAVITDRGPYVAGRDIDISYGLARKLSLVQKGVGTLTMRVIG